MTSADEHISGVGVDSENDNEYSYEDKRSKNKLRRKTTTGKESSLGKKRLSENPNTGTDEFVSEDIDENDNSLQGGISDSHNYTSNSMSKQKRKRQRRPKHESIHQYIDDRAEEDDEDEQDDYNGEYEVSKEEREALMNELPERINYLDKFRSMDPEEIAKRYQEEYTTEYDDELDTNRNQNLRHLPSLKDAKTFSVRCRIGSEREAAISLLNKYMALRGTKDEINIFSASALDKFPGCIFVEAHRDFHVKEAIKGIKTLNISKVKPVPVKEVTQVFTSDRSKVQHVEAQKFARIKKGLYAGDLVLIDGIDDTCKKAKIKLVPRLSTGGAVSDILDDDLKGRFGDKADSKKQVLRPAQKLFTPDDYPEAKAMDGKKKEMHVYSLNGLRFENGLLVRTIAINHLEVKDVVPSLEEIEMFTKGELRKENKDLLMEKAKIAIEESKAGLKNMEKGDRVKIIQGDLRGVPGEVVEVTEDHIKVLPHLDVTKEPITFLPNEIMKLFEPGENVEILGGKYKGITGTISKVEGNVALIISQDLKSEMKVLINNIKSSTSINAKIKDSSSLAIKDKFNRNFYQKRDLIILNDNKTVGVVVSVGNESVTIIDTESSVRTVSTVQLLNKLNPQGHTKNAHNQDIYPKCIVRVNDGLMKGKSAVVLHVYNDTLFLYDQNYNQNSGIFVERVNNCYLIGSTVYDNTKMMARFNNPYLAKAQQEMMDTNSPQHVVDEKKQVKAKQDPKTRRVNLIGQVKSILKGAYKGYSGMIQSLNGDMVRIELQAVNRCISVPLDSLDIDPMERESYSNLLGRLEI